MEMYDETDTNIVEETVYADFTCNNCDTPGARKISGTAGHSADIHPCPWCRCVLLDTDRPQGYDQACRISSLFSAFSYTHIVVSLYPKRRLRHAQTEVLFQECSHTATDKYSRKPRRSVLSAGLHSRMATLSNDCPRLYALYLSR